VAPKPDADTDAERQYVAAWRATLAAMKSGDSISGHERNMAFLNRAAPDRPGSRGFADISAISGLDFTDDARGLALVDWDRDGDLDLWFRNRSAPTLRLMENRMSAEQNAGRFLALRLEGTAANRDGIGARIEVTLADGSLLVRTLTAGSGFLSQSSKWLHFGLGEGAKVRSVAVRWPFGQREEFSGVAAGSWWHLAQGRGVAREADITPQQQPLASIAQQLPILDSSRTLLSAGVPLPEMNYLNADGKSEIVADPSGPHLIVFWTSWCPHCKAELEALALGAAELEAAGIDVLAINADAVIDGPKADDQELGEFLKGLGFAFPWGRDEGLALQKLKHLEHALLDRDTELAVPFACLLDAQGEASAFYRGPVEIAQVIRDAALLSGSANARRTSIVGFGGRSFSSPTSREGRLVDTGIQFQERFPLEAIRYLKMAVPPGQVDLKTNPVTRRIAGIYYLLGLDALEANDPTSAASYFSGSVEFRPDLLDARLNLSVARFRLGQVSEAKQVLEDLLAIDPAHAAARANLKVITAKLEKQP